MSKTTWVKFKKPGPAYGYSYFVGDVAELPEDAAAKLMEAGAVVPSTAPAPENKGK